MINPKEFIAVSHDAPCLICGKSDWCRVSGDGCIECHRTSVAVHSYKLLKVTQSGYGLYRSIDDNGTRPHASNGKGQSKLKAYPSPETAIKSILQSDNLNGSVHRDTWIYTGDDGSESFRILRFDFPGGDKQFRPLHRSCDGWVFKKPAGKSPLYNLHDIGGADRVYVVEGEKCVDAAKSIGLGAVTSSGGSNCAKSTNWTPLRGKRVIILPDNDEPGRKYAETVAGILHGIGCRVGIVPLPGLQEGDDLYDWIEARDSREPEDLKNWVEELADKATLYQLPNQPNNDTSNAQSLSKGSVRDSNLEPINILELSGGGGPEWTWEGYLSPGHVSLLTGLWKAGKTTLLGHLFKECGKGGYLATAVQPAKVLIISEESHSMWADRRDEIGIGSNVEVICRPFMLRPTFNEWYDFLGYMAELIKKDHFDIVVLDPITNLWPVLNENDASQVISALMPLHRLTVEGAGVLLCHHPRKGDGTEGRASRGSGALTGFVDIIIEFRRLNPEEKTDCRRVLTTYSRFDESPDEMVIDYTPNEGYTSCGTRADARCADRLAVIEEMLPAESPGMTVIDILKDWPDDTFPKPSKRTIQVDLKAAITDGIIYRAGEGKKCDPYRFWVDNSIRARSHCIGARSDSGSVEPTLKDE